MKAYRSFFMCSLCAHIVLLAFAETLIVSSVPRLRPPLKVTLFQKAVPLPMGDPGGPAGGEQSSLLPEPQPVEVSSPPPQTLPKRPKKAQKKPTPRPPLEIVKSEPQSEPLPAVESPPTTGIDAEGEETRGADDSNRGSDANTDGGGAGSTSGRGLGGTGPGSGGSGTLARPDYGVNPKPPYPLIARRMGTQGVVVLRVFVHPDGRVGEVAVSRSSGSDLLDDSALRTVREQWRFLPARLDGQPVESWVEVPIRFVLEQG